MTSKGNDHVKSKVLPTSTMVKNGASVSVDLLKLSQTDGK
jgi:hypothetical protein